jgi:L-alanine-DL-glutamate epimerase-like enolase superfamily enzyme
MRVAADLCGGLAAAREIAAVCREAGVELFVGSRARTDIGKRHAAVLAMAVTSVSFVELDDSRRNDDEPPCRVDAWAEAGIGVAFDGSELSDSRHEIKEVCRIASSRSDRSNAAP